MHGGTVPRQMTDIREAARRGFAEGEAKRAQARAEKQAAGAKAAEALQEWAQVHPIVAAAFDAAAREATAGLKEAGAKRAAVNHFMSSRDHNRPAGEAQREIPALRVDTEDGETRVLFAQPVYEETAVNFYEVQGARQTDYGSLPFASLKQADIKRVVGRFIKEALEG